MDGKAIAIVSGGMDSVTLAHQLKAHGWADLHLLSFYYGQRHRKEIEFAERCAERLGARWSLVDLYTVAGLLTGSALTDPSVDVPEGHYESETMKATVVPNRNAIMLSIAYGVAVAEGAKLVAIGVHAGDHAIYPDCRPEFILHARNMLRVANEGFGDPDLSVEAPFVYMTKAEIVKVGDELRVPWRETWTCYKGGEVHCGRCGTDVERKEAFALAGVEDPTGYEAAS
jgi:7-cyano-7-deazaguanine synthase